MVRRGLPGGGVVEVEAAGAVEGFGGDAGWAAVGQDGVLVGIAPIPVNALSTLPMPVDPVIVGVILFAPMLLILGRLFLARPGMGSRIPRLVGKLPVPRRRRVRPQRSRRTTRLGRPTPRTLLCLPTPTLSVPRSGRHPPSATAERAGRRRAEGLIRRTHPRTSPSGSAHPRKQDGIAPSGSGLPRSLWESCLGIIESETRETSQTADPDAGWPDC